MSKRTGLLVVCAVIVVAALAAFFLTRGDKAALPETAAIGPPHSRAHQNPYSDRPHRSCKGLAGGRATEGGERSRCDRVRDRAYASALALRTA
jgi:hypothetical protein